MFKIVFLCYNLFEEGDSMKILRLKINKFSLTKDDLIIDFLPISKKTLEDKEYELMAIASELYVFNTMAFIGKNASGKTTILRLLNMAYELLSFFRIEKFKNLITSPLVLELTFYYDAKIYYYHAQLQNENGIIKFRNESIYYRNYNKSCLKNIFDYSKYKKIEYTTLIPEDTSILFNVFKKIESKILYYSSDDDNTDIYFNIYKLLGENKPQVIRDILKLFDENLENIELTEHDLFKITYSNHSYEIINNRELHEKLSSGTAKGIALFVYVIYSLTKGIDLIVDEIENHFHRTLVENLINLYKDKLVNKYNATLIFSTHYPELLDLFNRSDNIYITKNNDQIYLENVYKNYNARNELLKSKRFYNNAFDTNVSYDNLMQFKSDLL